MAKPLGQRNLEDDFLKPRRDSKKNGKENVDPQQDDKKRQQRNFSRSKLYGVTEESLEPVSRKRNRDDAFGAQDEEYTTQYGSKSSKLESDDLSKEGQRPVERTDPSLDTISRKRKRGDPKGYGEQVMRGMEEAFRMRGMSEHSDASNRPSDDPSFGSSKSRRLNDQDLDSSKSRGLSDQQREEGGEILQRTMDILRSDNGRSVNTEKIKPEDLPEGVNRLRLYLRDGLRSGRVPKDYDETLKKAYKEVEDLEKSNGMSKNSFDGSNFKLTANELAMMTEKLKEMYQDSKDSESNFSQDFSEALAGAKKKSKDSSKSDNKQQKNVSNFFQKNWEILFETKETDTGQQSKEISLGDLPGPAQRLIKDLQAGEPINEQAHNELNDMLKDDGGASIIAKLREKLEKAEKHTGPKS